jgi:hypothetical protein
MIAVCSHDAGGAEVLSSYIKREKPDCKFCLAGPALSIFKRKLGNIKNVSLDECLIDADQLLCSSGWSDLEWNAIYEAKKKSKYVVVFLDHWTGYQARFQRNGINHFPNEIWVGDNYAFEIAEKLFPDIKIQLVENPYYLDLQDELEQLSKSLINEKFLRILYICEPTSRSEANINNLEYTDHSALKYFFECINKIHSLTETVCIRPHPNENKDKYDWALDNQHIQVVRGGDRSLIEDIADNDWVVGRESMALVVGLVAGKRVMTCIPPNTAQCKLPHREIEILSDVIEQISK